MIQNRDRQLFQYRNADNFNILLTKFYDIAKNIAPDNLIEILNINEANGDWLTQLALIFNVKRNYFSVGSGEDTFIFDVSYWDSTDVLDGVNTPMDDNLLRALLKAKILRNSTTPKTIDYIYNCFFTVFGNDLDIEVQEEGAKTIRITIDFGTNTNGFRILQALVAENEGWFGNPTGVDIITDFETDAK